MNVSDAMTPRSELVTVELPGSRDDALEHLQEGAFSSVPVVKVDDGSEHYRGLVSRETLIEQPDEDQLALLMEEVPTTTAGADLRVAAGLMVREQARRIPVVDGELEGIVTITDVVDAIAKGDVPGDACAGDGATRSVITAYQGTPLAVAERQLFHADLPYAVVLDDEGSMDGVFTEQDVIEVAEVVEGETRTGNSFADQDDDWMWEGIKGVGSRSVTTRDVELPEGTVADFMTADVVTISQSKTAQDAAQLMITHDIEQIPLVSGDGLVGIVRDVDLLAAIAEEE
jgi:CBS domain-containing protein